jgi:hypothetical protein
MSESKKSAKEAVKARRRQSIVTNSMTGYMHKRAIKSGRNWKRRYFILSQDILSYYEDEFKVLKLNPKGEIKSTRYRLLRSTTHQSMWLDNAGSQWTR